MHFSFQIESEYNVLQHTHGRSETQTATDVNFSEIAASEKLDIVRQNNINATDEAY